MDKTSHLSLILDLSPTQWHLSADPTNSSPLSFKTFLSHVLTFVNSHIASKPENTLAVFGAFPGKSVMLYSSIDQKSDAHEDVMGDPNSYRPFRLIDSVVAQNVEREFEHMNHATEEAPLALVGALTKALCCNTSFHRACALSTIAADINRITHPTTGSPLEDPSNFADPRILILSVSPDLSASYIPVMNSIFSAQKLKVTIDVCKVYGPDTVFLQQVAHLTGGSYIYLEKRDALLQYLLMTFLPPPSMRKFITVPTQDKVDFRAACFCHKNIVDIAFVCSVCLSIFCSPVPVCSTCRTKFPIKTLQRLNASRPATSANGSPRPNGTPKSTPPLRQNMQSSLR